MGLPTCRPLPRSHYDADSRGRCTNLSATPLTCVSCLPSQRVRWSGSSLSFSLPPSPFLFLSLSFSLSFLSLSFSLSLSLSLLLSFSLSLSLSHPFSPACVSSFSPPTKLRPSPSVFLCPLRRRLTQQCGVVVSCHPALRQRSSRTCVEATIDRSRILSLTVRRYLARPYI